MSVQALQSVAVAANGELPRKEIPQNAVQAAVYRHIVAWMPRTRIVEPSGRRWLVRTAEEFKTVGKGLPWAPWTIQKALRGLVADGWIEVRHAPHPFKRNKPHCTWLTVLERVENPNVAPPVCSPTYQQGHLETEQCLEQRFPNVTEQRFSISNKFSTRGQGEDASRFAAPRRISAALCEEAEEGSEVQKSEIGNLSLALSATVREVPHLSTGNIVPLAARGGAMPSAEDVIASLRAKKPPSADLNRPLKPTALHHEFGRAWIETYPGEAFAPTTARRLGQIKNLIDYLRTQKAEDAEIIAIVHSATRRWNDFVAFVAKHGGPKLSEVRPNIAAMLTHRDKLVNFHRAPAAPEAETDWGPDGLKPVKKMWTPPGA